MTETPGSVPPVRVGITPEAAAVLRRLRARHGPLMFHQSGGCCDGSAPMCYPRSEFIVGDEDVLLGVVEAVLLRVLVADVELRNGSRTHRAIASPSRTQS